jgi:hypothetical protein
MEAVVGPFGENDEPPTTMRPSGCNATLKP